MRTTYGILAVVLLAACAREEVQPTNLVVIALDTLRADHLGCYGYARPTSPRIDAFAGESVLFATAVSPAPWTLPAFASMFTGLLPSHHRAGEGRLPYVSALGPEHRTLATVLREHGLHTASFVSNIWVSHAVGLDGGFDTHARDMLPSQAVDHAVAWLSSRPSGRFFLFVHIFDPHAPYTPSPEHARLFLSTDYAGPFEKAFPTVWRNGAPVTEVDRKWTDADRRRIVDLYDAEIHSADALVGRVLDTLASLSLTDDTLVAVVSDHGEELFDHGKLDHGHTLYDELLLVPLILRFPRATPHARIATQVSSMDLFPTVLDALGVPAPSSLDATSLMPLIRGQSRSIPDAAFAEFVVRGPDPSAKALRLPGEKLILSPANGTRTYFDLATDPREKFDVASAHGERVRTLATQLERQLLVAPDGFHFFAVARGEHDVHLQLACDDGFMDAATFETEDDDRVTVGSDGLTLTIDLALRQRDSPVESHDLDVVRFRTRGGAPLRVQEATLDGAPFPASIFGVGGSLRLRELFPGTVLPNERLLVSHPIRPLRLEDGDVRVSLQLVRPHQPPAAALTPEAVERLRSLGYVNE